MATIRLLLVATSRWRAGRSDHKKVTGGKLWWAFLPLRITMGIDDAWLLFLCHADNYAVGVVVGEGLNGVALVA